MNKYIKSIIIVLGIFLVNVGLVKALESSYWFDSTGYYIDYSSPPTGNSCTWSNLQLEDGIVCSFPNQKSMRLVMDTSDGAPWSIPSNVNILGVEIISKHRITTSHSAANYAFPYVTNNITADTVPWVGTSASGCFTQPADDDPFDCGFYYTTSTTDFIEESAYWRNYPKGSPYRLEPEHINNGKAGFSIVVQDPTARTREWDYFWVRIHYELTEYSLTVDSSTADQNSGRATLDISGNVPLDDWNSNTWCRIDMFERCFATGRAGFTSQAPVARIDLYGGTDFQGQTKYKNENITDGNFDVDNIEVPLRNGMTCDYPTIVSCYERSCEEYTTYNYYVQGDVTQMRCDNYDTKIYESQGINAGEINFNESAIASPSATINAPEDLAPDCENTDIICHVMDQMTDFLSWLFIPNNTFNSLLVSEYQESLSSHAPFAYVYPIFFANTSDPTVSEDVPEFSFQAKLNNQWYEGTLDESVDYAGTVFNLIKNAINFLLYVGFITYLILLGRRLLPQ